MRLEVEMLKTLVTSFLIATLLTFLSVEADAFGFAEGVCIEISQ
jgi:hypothetical protein